MRKEIIVNADEFESRVAILENGELTELSVEREPKIVGNIYKARVISVLPGMDAAFADIGLEKNAFLCADDVGFVSDSGITTSGAPRSWGIAQRLKPKQEVVVQIVRAPVGTKGARATTRLALPGRYVVLLLYDEQQVGVSRKLDDRKERERLRKIGEQIRAEGHGLIIRTEAEGRGKREISADLKVLLELRDRLMDRAAKSSAPAVLHEDLTLTYQVIRDAFTDDVNALIIDAKSSYDNAVELVQHIAPHLRRRVKPYRGRLPIFHNYGVEEEIERLMRRRVWLASGGYISIDQAEAFAAIDVNTGRFTGSTGLADTILQTNLEAAAEIARQLRLRDLGGIIVIDFIDMEISGHRQRVMKAFQDAIKRDRQKTKVLHLSLLGLVEMTRKRRGESLMGIITEACAHCGGLGRVRKPLTVALKIEREVLRLAADERLQAVLVRGAPSVIALLVGEDGRRSAALDKAAGCPVYLRAEERLAPDDHEILPGTLAHITQQVKAYAKGDAIQLDSVEPRDPASDEPSYGWSGGYRVQLDGHAAGDRSAVLVLAEAGHSFGRAHPKAKSAEGEAEETRPKGKSTEEEAGEARPKPRSRRRGGRRRSKSKQKPSTGEQTSAAQEQQKPEPEKMPTEPVQPSKPPAEAPAPPETRPARPRTRRARPRTRPARPDTVPAPPETRPARPDTVSAPPETRPARPDTVPAPPESAPAGAPGGDRAEEKPTEAGVGGGKRAGSSGLLRRGARRAARSRH